jgi:hypothetical protein
MIEWASDLSGADWMLPRMPATVGLESPHGFDAYARVAHPDSTGTLPADQLDALIQVLARHTRTPGDCWFGVWDGYGFLQGPPAFARLQPRTGEPVGTQVARPSIATPRIMVNKRALVFYRDAIDGARALSEFGQSPNLWWPGDRAWCVATDIDLQTTHIGGTGALVEALLADTRHDAA